MHGRLVQVEGDNGGKVESCSSQFTTESATASGDAGVTRFNSRTLLSIKETEIPRRATQHTQTPAYAHGHTFTSPSDHSTVSTTTRPRPSTRGGLFPQLPQDIDMEQQTKVRASLPTDVPILPIHSCSRRLDYQSVRRVCLRRTRAAPNGDHPHMHTTSTTRQLTLTHTHTHTHIKPNPSLYRVCTVSCRVNKERGNEGTACPYVPVSHPPRGQQGMSGWDPNHPGRIRTLYSNQYGFDVLYEPTLLK